VELLGKCGVCMETNIGQAVGHGGILVPWASVCPDVCDGVVRTLRKVVGNQLRLQHGANGVDCPDELGLVVPVKVGGRPHDFK